MLYDINSETGDSQEMSSLNSFQMNTSRDMSISGQQDPIMERQLSSSNSNSNIDAGFTIVKKSSKMES